MGQFRVFKTSLLLLLSSAAVPAMAADQDVYGNQPPCCVPQLRGVPQQQAPADSSSGYQVNDGGYAAGYNWQSAVVQPQQPLSGGPDEPERPHHYRAPAQVVTEDSGGAYGQTGFDDGAFEFKPTLQIGTMYTNNVNLTHSHQQSDVGVEIRPSFTWGTKWPQNSWQGNFYIDWQRYFSTPEANRMTGEADTTFRLDIRHDTYAEFTGNWAMTEANPGSANNPSNAVEARRDMAYGASAGLAHDFGWWQGKATFGLTRTNFGDVRLDDGTTEVNSDMNYTSPSIALRGTMGSLGATVRPYAQITYDWRLHDQDVDRNGFHRDSEGFGAALGLVLSDGPTWSGDIAAVVMSRHFKDPSLPDALVPGVAATINWSPAPLWSFVANTGVAINDSSTAGISSNTVWTGGITAKYAVRDNLNLRGGVSVSVGSDDSGSGYDVGTIVQAGADWQVSKHVVLSGTLQQTWYNSPFETANYEEQRAFIGMTVQ